MSRRFPHPAVRISRRGLNTACMRWPKEILMSASRASSVARFSSSSRSSSSPRRGRGTRKAAPARDTASAPRAGDPIDYGPVRAAVRALATWAFDLAARDIAEDPDGLRRVETARQLVLAQLDDKPAPRGASLADVQFATLQIARLVDRDLKLGIGGHLDLIEMFEHRASDLLPDALATARKRRAGKRENTDVSGVVITLCPPGPVPEESLTAGFSPPRLRFCEDCGVVHEGSDHIPLRAYV
jgi:hypothetical protein